MQPIELAFSVLAALVVILAVLLYLNAKKASDAYPASTPELVKTLLEAAVNLAIKTPTPWDDLLAKAGIDAVDLEMVNNPDGSISLRKRVSPIEATAQAEPKAGGAG